MTLISVVLGRTFHYVDEILPFRFGEADLPVDDIAAVGLLVYFGVSTLLDASSSDDQSEDEQKEAELAVSEFSGNGAGILAAAGTVVSTFLLVFVAEWGDKSFFSTIDSSESRTNPAQDPASCYYLHPNENPSLVLVSPSLTGTNYHHWARAMTMALMSKNKFQFVDGTIPVPAVTDPLFPAWQRCNTMVLTWINRSLSPSIAQSVLWINKAVDVWTDLRDRFSHGDAFRVAELQEQLYQFHQALAAASSPLGVIGGALAGHGVATLLAVLGGSLLGTFLSEKVIAYTGGVLFLVFAAVTLFEIVN